MCTDVSVADSESNNRMLLSIVLFTNKQSVMIIFCITLMTPLCHLPDIIPFALLLTKTQFLISILSYLLIISLEH